MNFGIGLVTNRVGMRPWWSTLLQFSEPPRTKDVTCTLLWVDATHTMESCVEALALAQLLRSDWLRVELVFPDDPHTPVGLLRNRVLGMADALDVDAMVWFDDDDWFSPTWIADSVHYVFGSGVRASKAWPQEDTWAPWWFWSWPNAYAMMQADGSAWAPLQPVARTPPLGGTIFNLRHASNAIRFDAGPSCSDVRRFEAMADAAVAANGVLRPHDCEIKPQHTLFARDRREPQYVNVRHAGNTGNTAALRANRLGLPELRPELEALFLPPTPDWRVHERGLRG